MADTTLAKDAGGLTPRSFMCMIRVDHPMQMRCCIFDVVVLVLSCSALRCDHSAAVNILKISIRELVMALRILTTLVIYS
jgi:hypothetical protein